MSLFFGRFELDTDRRLLLAAGDEIHISKKGYELLRVLLERAPKAISKVDLHDLIWPETYVSDTTLPGVIAELRNALGDDAREPQFIRTVHGFGYAFATKPRVTASPAPSRSARLLVLGREVFLSPGENVIGRDPEAKVYVDDLSVSRQHARVTLGGDDAVLEDFGSKNGTLHNGVAVTQAVTLRDRDVITTGTVTLVYRESPATAATVTIHR